MQKPGHLTFATKPLISNFMRNKKNMLCLFQLISIDTPDLNYSLQ